MPIRIKPYSSAPGGNWGITPDMVDAPSPVETPPPKKKSPLSYAPEKPVYAPEKPVYAPLSLKSPKPKPKATVMAAETQYDIATKEWEFMLHMHDSTVGCIVPSYVLEDMKYGSHPVDNLKHYVVSQVMQHLEAQVVQAVGSMINKHEALGGS